MSAVVVLITSFIGSFLGAWLYEWRAARGKIKIEPKVFQTSLDKEILTELVDVKPVIKRKPRTADEHALKREKEIDQSGEQVIVR